MYFQKPDSILVCFKN